MYYCLKNFTLSISHIYSLDFTQDDNFLLSGSADETVMVWSMEEAFFDSEGNAADASASLSFGPSFDVRFFDTDGSSSQSGSSWVGSRMAAPDDTNSIQLLEDGRSVYRSPAEASSRVAAVALSADAETVAYGCESGAVRILRPQIGLVKLLGWHDGAVRYLAVGADGVTVVSAGEDRVVR